MDDASLNGNGRGMSSICYAQLSEQTIYVGFHRSLGNVRSAAISLFARPATIRSNTRSSRAVNSCVDIRSANFSAICGGIKVRPPWTAWMVESNSSHVIPFEGKPSRAEVIGKYLHPRQRLSTR